LIELRFRRVDYNKYENFLKSDLDFDIHTTVSLPIEVAALYKYVIQKITHKKIGLIDREGNTYAVLDPPVRKKVASRVLSYHLAFVWESIIHNVRGRIREFDELVQRLPALVAYVKTLNNSGNRIVRVNVYAPEPAIGIFGEPSIAGFPIFSISFAYAYSLVYWLSNTDEILNSSAHSYARTTLLPRYRVMFNRHIEEIESIMRSAQVTHSDLRGYIVSYLKGIKKMDLRNPPLDFLQGLYELGLSIYDLVDAILMLEAEGFVKVTRDNQNRPLEVTLNERVA